MRDIIYTQRLILGRNMKSTKLLMMLALFSSIAIYSVKEKTGALPSNVSFTIGKSPEEKRNNIERLGDHIRQSQAKKTVSIQAPIKKPDQNKCPKRFLIDAEKYLKNKSYAPPVKRKQLSPEQKYQRSLTLILERYRLENKKLT